MGLIMNHSRQPEHVERRSDRSRWVLVGFLAVAAFFLWTEHRAHLLGALPYLLLLACPLMHLFHHHGSGNSSAAGNVKQVPPHEEEKP
jgi:hypothetical protein